MFDAIQQQPADPIMALMAQFRADPHPAKLDLGVGVYRDEQGSTPVFQAVKEAERILRSCPSAWCSSADPRMRSEG